MTRALRRLAAVALVFVVVIGAALYIGAHTSRWRWFVGGLLAGPVIAACVALVECRDR